MFRASDCVLTGVRHLLGRSANPVEYMVGQISELPGEKSALALVRSLPRGNSGLGDAAYQSASRAGGRSQGSPPRKRPPPRCGLLVRRTESVPLALIPVGRGRFPSCPCRRGSTPFSRRRRSGRPPAPGGVGQQRRAEICDRRVVRAREKQVMACKVRRSGCFRS
jgi:hypothetical protein